MDSKVFEYVVALADTGSYANAAKSLYITPQGLSSAVKRLESSLGVPLFQGNHDGVVLTEYGRIFYRFAAQFKHDYASVMEELEELRHKESKLILFAVSTGLFNVLTRETVLSYNEKSELGAQVKIVRTVVDNDCENCLLDKTCDFSLLNNPVDNEALFSVPLHKDWMFLWLPADAPLAQKGKATCADLAGMHLVCLTPDEYVASRNIESLLVDSNLECVIYPVDEMIEVLELAMKMGIPGITVRSHVNAFPEAGYVGIPIEDLTWGFSVAYRKDRVLSPWDEEFLAFLSSQATFYC